jgi:hypothetical protein
MGLRPYRRQNSGRCDLRASSCSTAFGCRGQSNSCVRRNRLHLLRRRWVGTGTSRPTLPHPSDGVSPLALPHRYWPAVFFCFMFLCSFNFLILLACRDLQLGWQVATAGQLVDPLSSPCSHGEALGKLEATGTSESMTSAKSRGNLLRKHRQEYLMKCREGR